MVPGDRGYFVFPWLSRFHVSASSQPLFHIFSKRLKCHPLDVGFTVMQIISYVVMEASTRSQSLGKQAELFATPNAVLSSKAEGEKPKL
jgi:hypothetical protein